jgi:hypothetical protein
MPKICVPARDWPIDLHQPLSVILNLHCCLAHAKAFDVNEFLDMPTPAAGKTNKIIFEMMAAGKQPPDFDRAFVSAVALNSKEVLALMAHMKG